MPELPDITVYVESLRQRIIGQTLTSIRIASPFLVRSVKPFIDEAEGKKVLDVQRVSKRIVIALESNLFLVFHLMIVGRFLWKEQATRAVSKITLATFRFSTGTLIMTEAGKTKRASLFLVRGTDSLASHDPGGLEVLDADLADFREAILKENRTLKRALTDQRILSGIGNAYSDEILHAARLSPIKHSGKLTYQEFGRLYNATQDTLRKWLEILRSEFTDRFPGPGDVTAFREGFAVHGRFDKPCPVCGTAIQRIRYAANETNYCPSCQTEGHILADRSLSRLLKDDWPRTVDELENKHGS